MTALVNKSEGNSVDVARWGLNLSVTEELDDWSSQWTEVFQGKGVWGGRTRGGRGVQRITGRTQDISVEGITLAFCGKELLQRTSLKLVHGHRYGLIGENGVGKSTLLRRLAKQSIPGVPLHFRFGYVQQELLVAEDMSVLDFIINGTQGYGVGIEEQLADLRKDEAELEQLMEGESDNDKLGELAEQLCEIVEEIEKLELKLSNNENKTNGADDASAGAKGGDLKRADIEALGSKVVEVLDGLGLSKPPKRLSLRLSELSGGWRMRAALAQVLVHLENIDVLLLDEPTNHLDLPSIAWLQDYLSASSPIVLFVSHDRSFLSTVSTDIIEMKSQQLHYFAGGYEDFLLHAEEMEARRQHAVDARGRKEAHLQKTIEQAKARGDEGTVRTKQKKLERAAFTRNIDGHKFKLFSLSKMDEKAVRMPEIYDPNPHFPTNDNTSNYHTNKFKFPAVDYSALRLSSPLSPLLTLNKVSLGYESKGNVKILLEEVTLQLGLYSRVGIVGRNGTGKSSLLHALAYAHTVGKVAVPTHSTANSLIVSSGEVWKHHNLRIGVVAQHQIDILSQYLFHTPITYLQHLLEQHNASSTSKSQYNEQELRGHLGAFGLTGPLSLQPIGSLSGGQKARLSFASVCLFRPHLIFLDEPSNHLSMESIEALVKACQEYSGGIVVISHNRHFLSQICNELFVITKNNPTNSNAVKKNSMAAKAHAPVPASPSNAYKVSVRKVSKGETADQAAAQSSPLSSSGAIDHSSMYSEEQRQAFGEILERAIAEQMSM